MISLNNPLEFRVQNVGLWQWEIQTNTSDDLVNPNEFPTIHDGH